MRIENKIAEKFNISIEEANSLINYIDCYIGIDWSESSYSKIFKACKEAMKEMA
jgi:hypothetical protein